MYQAKSCVILFGWGSAKIKVNQNVPKDILVLKSDEIFEIVKMFQWPQRTNQAYQRMYAQILSR